MEKKKKDPQVKVPIGFSPVLLEKARELAENRYTSLAGLVRSLLIKELEEEAKK